MARKLLLEEFSSNVFLHPRDHPRIKGLQIILDLCPLTKETEVPMQYLSHMFYVYVLLRAGVLKR